MFQVVFVGSAAWKVRVLGRNLCFGATFLPQTSASLVSSTVSIEAGAALRREILKTDATQKACDPRDHGWLGSPYRLLGQQTERVGCCEVDE